VLKKLLMEMYPELSARTGKTDQDREDMEEALKVYWAAIPKDTFNSLYKSYSNRIEACIAADGWHTKY
jgi:hypothetical protein